VIDKLSRIANEALGAEEVIRALRTHGIDPLGGSPEDFARFIASETEKMAGVAAMGGIKN
jgi:hypothetical protein